MKAALASSLLLLLAACQQRLPPPAYIAPESRPVPDARRIHELVREIASLDGEFTVPDHVYALIADHRPIAELASADTAAIPALVECLRDDRPARIRLQGQRVPVGMVCAYALVETPYVQQHLQFSCFPPDWHGLVTPTIDMDALLAAWRDWKTWLTTHPFNGAANGATASVRCSWQTPYPCTCPPHSNSARTPSNER